MDHCQSLTVTISSVLSLTRGSAIAVDLAVIILTWIKTFRHWRRLHQLHLNISVTDILIRDEVGDASHASGYMCDADTRINNLAEEIRFSPLSRIDAASG